MTDLSSIPTSTLVEELSKRGGVRQLIVGADECSYSCYAGPNDLRNWGSQCHGNGPAKILVVRE